jgi:thiol-disulfide isomerase/thioredoxin
MRRVILSYLLAIISTIGLLASSIEVPITIQVENATCNALYIQKAHLEDTQLSTTHRIDLTEGYARFVYTVDQSGFIDLLYNGYTIPIYLDQSSSPTIQWDERNIAKSLQFDGKGAADNNLMADYYRTLGGTSVHIKECSYLDIYFDQSAVDAAGSSDAVTYAQAVDATYQRQMNSLSRYQPSSQAKVYDFYVKKALYDKEANKLNWILARLDILSASEVASAKQVLNLNDQVIIQGSGDVNHPAYRNLLKAASIWKYLPNNARKHRAYTKIYPLIEQNFSGEARCYLTSQLLVKVYEKSGESELGRSKIGELSQSCPQYTNQIMDMYGSDISGVEDIAAVDIDMIDKSGSLVSLEDYAGKVVYISFWASWCKPCIAGFKKSKEIRKQLQDLGVVLINVSIDKKEEAWRDAMIRYNPQGINTWAISLQDLAKDYDISAIPLYHIVNKQGKFAYLSTEGGRNIVEEFRVLVEQ